MRTKNVKELMEMIFYFTVQIYQVQEADKKCEKLEGRGFVDRHFRGMVTRASKANNELLDEVHKTYPSVYINTNPRVLEDRLDKMLNSLYYEMNKKGTGATDEKEIDFDSVKVGLPKPFRVFLSGVVVATNLFDKKYRSLMDENILKIWDKYKNRVDTIFNKLINEQVIWYEKEVI